MKNGIRKKAWLAVGLALGVGSVAYTGDSWAGAVIYNTGSAATAPIALGVDDEGQLNIRDATGVTSTANASGVIGLAYRDGAGDWLDSTSPGCLCEGWGVSATTSGGSVTGWANNDDGVSNLTVNSFSTDAGAGTGSFATSVVSLTSIPEITVSQSYSAADNAPGVLFKNEVVITNGTDMTIDDLRYVRVMDWDIPYTEFTEAVTIRGTGTTTLLERSHDDGFESANPLATTTPLNAASLDTDFIDLEPGDDHGAYFLFNFGSLAAGESYSFTTFYGAAETEAEMLAALALEQIELFSLGQSEEDLDGLTYAFGFTGVGGEPIIPPTGIPEPPTVLLMSLGLLAILRRKSFIR